MQESFYDALAPYYHLLYPDWEASIGRQAQALVTLLGEFAVPPGARVLDAACGIGTQALGLAAAGYDVVASDLSAGALSRLRGEAERRGLSIHSRVADLRTLSESFTDPFAAVLACDNAVAHLLTDAEIATALTKCRRCLRSGGLLILSVRDYATILRRSPDVRPYALRTEGDRRCSASQIWEWEGDRYDMTLHLTDESCGENPRVHAFHTRLYAVTIARLLELLAAAGFAHVERRDGAFFQPLVIGVARKMRRVLVLGSSGVGKSTFASQLAAIVELPLIHLDAHFWQAGWREPPRDDWSRRLELLLRGDAWIMDGNYRRTIPQRVEAADTVILLTLPRIQCLSRVITRGVRDRGKTRTDLPAECVEQLPDWSFLQRIWLYPRAELGPLLDLLSTYEGRKTIVVLRSSAACRKYLASLLDG